MTGSSKGVSWSRRRKVSATSQVGGAWRPVEREAWNWWARQAAWVISTSPSWKIEPPSTASLVANDTLGIRSTSLAELLGLNWRPIRLLFPCSEGDSATSQPDLSVVLVLGSVKDLFKCNGYSSAWAKSSVITAFRESLGLLAMQESSRRS